MGFYDGAKIVTNELVLSLDAADRSSYVSGSNSWVDLTGNNNNGTLTNGPSFNSENGGAIVFDGVNDYVNITDSDTFNLSNLTVISWFYIQNFPGFSQYRIINHQESTFRAWGLQMGRGDYVGGYTSSDAILFCHSNNGVSALNLSSPVKLQIGTWYQGGFSNNGTTLKIYVNGQVSNSTTSLGNQYSTIASDICIGVTAGGKNAFFWDGRIATAQIYNRALSDSEVLQNYNAQKSRFGL